MSDNEGRVFLRGITSETYGLGEFRRRQRAAPRVRPAGTVVDDASVGHSGDSSQSRTSWMLGPGDDPFLTQSLQMHYVGVLTWLVPVQMGWLVGHVPGAGLVRDGSRLLSLCAVGVASVLGYGASTLVGRLPRPARPGSAFALVLLPVALMPDAAFGVSGRLTPAELPPDYDAARSVVQRAHDAGSVGDVLVLPLSSYRQPSWNHDRKVLDPVGRFLPLDYVAERRPVRRWRAHTR